MKSQMFLALAVLLLTVALATGGLRPVHAGEQPAGSGYKVLEPIPAWKSDGVSRWSLPSLMPPAIS